MRTWTSSRRILHHWLPASSPRRLRPRARRWAGQRVYHGVRRPDHDPRGLWRAHRLASALADDYDQPLAVSRLCCRWVYSQHSGGILATIIVGVAVLVLLIPFGILGTLGFFLLTAKSFGIGGPVETLLRRQYLWWNSRQMALRIDQGSPGRSSGSRQPPRP